MKISPVNNYFFHKNFNANNQNNIKTSTFKGNGIIYYSGDDDYWIRRDVYPDLPDDNDDNDDINDDINYPMPEDDRLQDDFDPTDEDNETPPEKESYSVANLHMDNFPC